MARGFFVSETINRPIWEVWAFLIDFRNAPKWMTGVEEFALSHGSEIKAGARYSFKSRGFTREGEVTFYEPGRKIALTSHQGRVTATYTYILREKGASTEVQMEAACKASGLWFLAHPLMAYRMRKSDGNHIAQLKQAMEVPVAKARKVKASN